MSTSEPCFIYRCMLCDTKFLSKTGGGTEAIVRSIIAGVDPMNFMVGEYEPHDCEDDHIGRAVLIGWSVESKSVHSTTGA